jgi:pimeloyl-ACP methyl ester carboxylesterase
MPFVQTDDEGSLLYRDWGEGEPVVFRAAWALSSIAWQYQMISLWTGADAPWLTTDAATDAQTTGRGYDYDTLAEDLASVLDHLDPKTSS